MDYKRIIKSRKARLYVLDLLSFIPDRLMLRIQYRMKLKRKLNLKNPERYTEKVQWYKLNYKNPLMVQCVDKYDVREFIRQQGLEDILVKNYGVFERVEDIDFDSLPSKFVLKNTLGMGGNSVIICRNKSDLNIEETRSQISEWLKPLHKNSGGREWPYYSGKKPRIIIEELLEDDNPGGLIDYKFTCCNGRTACIFVLYDRALGNSAKMATYDRDFNDLHISEVAELVGEGVPKPEGYQEMLEIAEMLAKNFPLVRVDLYNVKGKTYFGELTYYDESGYTQFVPDEFDFTLGSMFDLPELMRNKSIRKEKRKRRV